VEGPLCGYTGLGMFSKERSAVETAKRSGPSGSQPPISPVDMHRRSLFQEPAKFTVGDSAPLELPDSQRVHRVAVLQKLDCLPVVHARRDLREVGSLLRELNV
jgi:hypothetical protein